MEIKQVNNLSNENYHNSEQYKEYWSSSNLKEYLKTPKEAYFKKYVAEKKQSAAFDFGNAFHDFLASKHVNGQPFEYNEFEPPKNPKTGNSYGRETKRYQDALSIIENPISGDDIQLINNLWYMMKKSPYMWYIHENILKKGVAEASFFVDGLHQYKYRADVVTDSAIFDWKTINKSKWSEKGIKNHIFDFGYDISAAMYQYFEHKRTKIWKPFIIIWIMKEPPYDILIDDISEKYSYDVVGGNIVANNGALAWEKIKDQHEACQAANEWPGLASKYNVNKGVRFADYVPAPYQERYFEDFNFDDKF